MAESDSDFWTQSQISSEETAVRHAMRSRLRCENRRVLDPEPRGECRREEAGNEGGERSAIDDQDCLTPSRALASQGRELER